MIASGESACGNYCFNGATANSPWRTSPGGFSIPWSRSASMGPRRIRRGEPLSRVVRDVLGRRDASMGPRRIRRGERPGKHPRVKWKDGFNGATANSPWRTCTLTVTTNQVTVLQWGHGEFAVENEWVARAPWKANGELQWGHGEFAVENAKPQGSLAYCGKLQWGHGEFAVENRTCLYLEEHGTQASMGPRRIRRGERQCPSR